MNYYYVPLQSIYAYRYSIIFAKKRNNEKIYVETYELKQFTLHSIVRIQSGARIRNTHLSAKRCI